MATLKDVAKDAGVSIATVSCCLSGSKPVKPETKMRVMDSIEKLRYIPNASARNLKSFSSNVIGVVLTDIDNLYHAEIFKGISAYLQIQNYTVSVAFSSNSPDIECEKINNFISQNVAGLIVITCQPQNSEFFQSRILNYNIPIVFVERNPKDMFVNFAGFHNYKTTYHITHSLLKKGYHNIALVCGSSDFSSEKECIDGYSDALNNEGVGLDSELICETNMSKEDSFKSVLTTISKKPLQAVITTTENIAAGTLEALYNRGLKVPENVLLITFSEESWNKFSRFPGVIYTSRTAFDLGNSASKLLLKNIQSPLLFEPQIIIFHDNITERKLDISIATRLKPIIKPSVNHNKRLRMLIVDLPTAYSARLLSESFTRKTGINIEFDILPQNEILKRISGTINNPDDSYDIYMYDIPWLSYMVQNSLVADISDFINSDNFKKERIFNENMANCTYEGKYYGMPIIGGSQIMFYRKDLFENREYIKAFKHKYSISLRPPKTWTEFNGTSEFFTKAYNPNSPTRFGTSFAGITDEELAPEILVRLWAYGGTLWDNYNRPCLNTMENVKAFESILDTLKCVGSSPFDTSIKQTVTDFSNGKTAMLITYTEYAAQISQSLHDNLIGRVGYEILPGKRPASIGWNIGLNPFSPNRTLAFEYFNWLCQHDTSFYMTILDGQSPVIDPHHSLELLKLYPWLTITEKSFAYAQKRTGPYKRNTLIIPQNKIEKILCDVLRMIINEKRTIQEALITNQKKMIKLFASYGYPKPTCR